MNFKSDSLYLIPRGSFVDKNNNIQYVGSIEIAEKIKIFVITIAQFPQDLSKEELEFRKLNLFIQGDSAYSKTEHWIMIETWSNLDDLFFEFSEYVANKFGLKLGKI